MNLKLTQALLTLGTIVLSACSSSDDLQGPDAPKNTPGAGNEVRFVVGSPSSRSQYVDQYKIRWTPGDKIYIYSPDVNINYTNEDNIDTAPPRTNSQSGAYIVLDSDIDNQHKIQAYGAGDKLFWSNGTCRGFWDGTAPTQDAANSGWHRFFAAYPSDRVILTDGKVDLLNKTQRGTAVFDMKHVTNQMVEIPADSVFVSLGSLEYHSKPDMNNAYMMAMRDVKVDHYNDNVLLDFDPIMTTLSMRITAEGFEVPTGVTACHRITGVSIIMPKGMSQKKIRYDLTKGTAHTTGQMRPVDGITTEEGVGKLAEGSVGDFSETIFVGIKDYSTGTERNYVDLYAQETLQLMAFLPPLPINDTKGTKIRIHTVGDYDYTVTLKDNQLLLQQSRVEINLPKVNPFNTNMSNKWMSRLDARIPLSELSIPGYTFAQGNDLSLDQIKDAITKAYNAGYRAFDITNITANEANNHLNHSGYHYEGTTFIADDPILNHFKTLPGPIFLYINADHSLKYQSTPGVYGNNYKSPELAKTTTGLNSTENTTYILYKRHHTKVENWKTNHYYNLSLNNDKGDIEDLTENDATITASGAVKETKWFVYYADPSDKSIYNWLANDRGEEGHLGFVFINNPMSPEAKMLVSAIIDSNFKYIH